MHLLIFFILFTGHKIKIQLNPPAFKFILFQSQAEVFQSQFLTSSNLFLAKWRRCRHHHHCLYKMFYLRSTNISNKHGCNGVCLGFFARKYFFFFFCFILQFFKSFSSKLRFMLFALMSIVIKTLSSSSYRHRFRPFCKLKGKKGFKVLIRRLQVKVRMLGNGFSDID